MINRILDNGISVNNTESMNRKIRISNLIVVLTASVLLCYTPVYIYYKQPVAIALNGFFFLSSIITFFLIHQKHYVLSFFFHVCCGFAYFIASTLVYGTKMNLHFFLLIQCMISVVIFNSLRTIQVFLVLAIGSFFGLIAWSYFYPPLILIPKQSAMAGTFMGNLNLLLLFLISSLFILFCKLEMVKSQKRILEQKGLIEAKNRDITDSILYAQRIQAALLPGRPLLQSIFPDHFLFFKPKDIVSGDFYWVFEHEDYQFIAVGDCTGHGVPGSMMSVLGINLLREIVENKEIREPKIILDEMRTGIVTAFDKDGIARDNKDGMDLALVRINRKTNTYLFSAANNPLYHLSGTELEERLADRQPVGYSPGMESFTQTEFAYKNGDILVLFTDGFADQFGGPKNKKYRYKPFQELLSERREENLEQVLSNAFYTWKGELEQVDDVCILGVRL